MLRPGNERGLCRLPVVFAVGLMVGLWASGPAVAEGGLQSFLAWLQELFLADSVPRPPELTAQDIAAIGKLRLILEAQNEARETAGNHMLLGALAAAQGHEPVAKEHFARAAVLEPRSPLPLTALGQACLQEGRVAEALEAHRGALDRASAPAARRAGLNINSHFDLAVAHAHAAERAEDPRERAAARREARAQAEEATTALRVQDLPPPMKALGYIQADTVYGRVLEDRARALEVRQRGIETVPGGEDLVTQQMVYQFSLDLAQEAEGKEDKLRYLEHAARAAGRLPGPLKVDSQVQVGRVYIQLLEEAPDPGAAEGLSRLIREVESDATQALSLKRSALVLEARLARDRAPEKAERLLEEAKRVDKELRARKFLEIEQAFEEPGPRPREPELRGRIRPGGRR